MGENILRFYRENVKKEWKTAFLSAVIVGFFGAYLPFYQLLPQS